MPQYVPEFGSRFPVIPPEGCPSSYGGGVGDLRAAHLSLDVREAAWKDIGQSAIGPATELSIAAVFRREPSDPVHVVETNELLVPAGDPLADKAEAVRRSPERLAALRRTVCTAVITCEGLRIVEEDGETFPVCGALTPDLVKDFLEEQDL